MKDDKELPATEELTIAEAARLLDLDRRTVKKLIVQGVLRARLASPPKSLRPRYRLPTEEVLAYRNGYSAFRSPRPSGGKQAAQRRHSGEFPHISLRRPGR